MYEERFGLTGRPFQLTPDARFWYETATHRKAMAYLGYGLTQGEGFIVVTGDVGAGKTTLVGHLTEQLDPAALNVVTIVSTAIQADDLLRIVAGGLGVDPAGLTKAQLLTAIERGLHAVARSGRRTLLIVDEVQVLPVESIEELRMLSNFQAGGHALLQILLLGQPEFRDRLHGSARLEQLRQRVIAIHHLDPMEPGEVADYVAHRLSLVGWQGRPDFTEDAFDALYQGSGGVPRRLNLLAGRVMLQAAIEDLTLIDARVVGNVLRDLHADLPILALEAADAPAAGVDSDRFDDTAVPRATRVEPDMAEEATEPAPVTLDDSDDRVRRFVPRSPRWLELDAAGPEAAAETHVEAGAEALTQRVAALEARIEEQEAALRRVLTLLVDWVEGDRSDAPSATAVATAAMPIRNPNAWDDAA